MIKIFLNGKIYTADENQLEATAFVVEDGKFIYVGSDEEAIKFKENNTEIHDFKGSRILPGLMDTHCHYIAMASKSADDNIEIDQKMSHNDLLNFLAQIVKNKTIEELPFVIGLGYGTQCIPLASELDKVINDRPVFLWDSGGHSGWMNTKLMDIIGINKDTPDPKPAISYFTRDDDGNPTGQAVENDAMLYVEKRMGAASPEVLKKQFPDLCKLINSYGYTSAFDAGFLLMDEEIVLKTLNSMDFSLRLFTSFYYDGFQKTSTFLKEMKKCRDLYISDKIYPLTLKMFKDGTV
ncbi:amidohydrolase family protein, partial [Methanobrevibacter sp. OttesenSCG-928-I08]|nr:amidohydrolase family protein [Methanobrevibacter sp. OttesenSCG-928-I08]